MQTKEEYINYLKEAIEYYKTEEYQNLIKKYKEETADIKDIFKKQEIWNKYLDPNKNKIAELYKKYQTNKMQLMEISQQFNKDAEVIKLNIEISKYITM